MYFDYLKKDTHPIWNEDKTRFILMVGDIFDYEQGRRELEEKGHEFKYGKSHAEFVLHGLEKWRRDLIRELNGFFVFLLYDTENRALTIVNDRYRSIVSSEKYWRYDEIKVDHESSLDELVDEGVRFFRQAVERQTRGLRRCVVPLSGGMDDRSIPLFLYFE